jgi:hypothetical protein
MVGDHAWRRRRLDGGAAGGSDLLGATRRLAARVVHDVAAVVVGRRHAGRRTRTRRRVDRSLSPRQNVAASLRPCNSTTCIHHGAFTTSHYNMQLQVYMIFSNE